MGQDLVARCMDAIEGISVGLATSGTTVGETPGLQALQACLADAQQSEQLANNLSAYLTQLLRWQRTQRLVGWSTPVDILRRGIVPSIIGAALIEPKATVTDIGSGAGLPGLILAMVPYLGLVTMVEARRKRASFLASVRRELGFVTQCAVIHGRYGVEPMELDQGSVLTARAFAPLDQVLSLGNELGSSSIIVWGGKHEYRLGQVLGDRFQLMGIVETTEGKNMRWVRIDRG